jgi:hypothetical protein
MKLRRENLVMLFSPYSHERGCQLSVSEALQERNMSEVGH